MADVEKHAYMEEMDEEGNIIDDTKTYVSTVHPGDGDRREANVSRTRNNNRPSRRDSSSPNIHTDTEPTTLRPSPLKRESKKSRDERPRDKEKKSVSIRRPHIKESKTAPHINSSASRRHQEQPAYYGVSPNAASPVMTPAVTSTRKRANTSNPPWTPSYNIYSPHSPKPPQANARFWQHPPPNQALGTSLPPQSPFMPGTSPYHAPYPGMPMPMPMPMAIPMPAPAPPHTAGPFPQPDYFTSQPPRDLGARFDFKRPRSAMAHPAQHAIDFGQDFDEDYEDGGAALVRRRPSLRHRTTHHEEDRRRMPPPARPSTSRPSSTNSPFVPPPLKRQSIGSIGSLDYDNESFDEDSFYQGTSPPDPYDYRPYPNRRPSIDSTLVYDGSHRFAEAAGRRSRRGSHHGARNQSTERAVDERLHSALRYQEDIDGPTIPLTARSLQEMTKPHSNRTKSTGSRDESGYNMPRSATSRTMMDNEDMTILVKGTATLTIGNASMDVNDGTEIRIPTTGGDKNSRGEGSDNASSYDERRTVFDRPRARTRGNSRAGSRSHGLPYLPTPPSQQDYGDYHPHYQQMPMAYAPPNSHPYTYPSQF